MGWLPAAPGPGGAETVPEHDFDTRTWCAKSGEREDVVVALLERRRDVDRRFLAILQRDHERPVVDVDEHGIPVARGVSQGDGVLVTRDVREGLRVRVPVLAHLE